MASRIPQALEPYLHIPSHRSLTVLTSILGASVNWLVLRFLYIALSKNIPHQVDRAEGSEENDDYVVVLVSFLRDFGFWKENAIRLGLDLELLSRQHRFQYIDGITRLFKSSISKEEASPSKLKHVDYLQEPDLKAIEAQIISYISRLKESSKEPDNVILVVDNVDVLLATLPSVHAYELREMLLSLRENAHCMILSLAADAPLIQQQSTPLESEHSSLVVGLSHQTSLLMSARALSSGVAAEVGGVLRVKSEIGLGEWLYSVGKDGLVKVWTRGE